MTFDVTIGDADKLIIEDYLAKTNDGISKVAHHSMVNMIVNDYADAASFKEAMEEYRKNPDDVWSHAELMRYYGWA